MSSPFVYAVIRSRDELKRLIMSDCEELRQPLPLSRKVTKTDEMVRTYIVMFFKPIGRMEEMQEK